MIIVLPLFEWKGTESTHIVTRLVRLDHTGRVPLIWFNDNLLQGIDESRSYLWLISTRWNDHLPTFEWKRTGSTHMNFSLVRLGHS